MGRRHILAAMVASASVVAPLAGQSGPGGTIAVVNKRADQVDVIDVASGVILTTLPTGGGPHELVVSSDGRTAVVTNYGGGGAGGNSLTVIDVPGLRVVRTIDLGRYTRPHGIQFLPGDSLVAVTSESTRNVVLVRLSDGRVVSAIDTEQGGSHMLGVVGDGSRIYTGNMADHTVSELDAHSQTILRRFEVPATPEAITVHPDGSEVWVGSNAEGTVSVVNTVDGSLETPLAGFGWPYRILIVPQRDVVVLPDLRGHELRVVDHDSREELARLEFPGGGPQGVTVTPDGRWLFLSLSREDRVVLIDLESFEVVRSFETGAGPDGIGWSALELAGSGAGA